MTDIGKTDTDPIGNVDHLTIFARSKQRASLFCIDQSICGNNIRSCRTFALAIFPFRFHFLNMGGIAVLNDAVGGVTVQVTDDFSAIDPSIGMGEVTLHGQQAVHFVRTRKGLGDQLNLSRIERHKTYFDGLMEALQEKLENSSSFALSLYDQMSPYIVTDCSVNALTGILERYADYELVEIVSSEGENARGAKYMEFYLDEEKLDALILRLFYAPQE